MGRGAARRMTMVPPATAQVWTASPGVLTDVHWSRLGALLDDGERAKARRFKLQADRHAYVLAHALMRLALAHALDVSPMAIVLSHDSRGKPVLLSPARPDVCFSHSRSRLLVACVVTTLGPVGIDVEPIREGHADFDLLARFVALRDPACQHERAAPAARRFFFLWTALEAFWKAQGTGLASGNRPHPLRGVRDRRLRHPAGRDRRRRAASSRDPAAVCRRMRDRRGAEVSAGSVPGSGSAVHPGNGRNATDQ